MRITLPAIIATTILLASPLLAQNEVLRHRRGHFRAGVNPFADYENADAYTVLLLHCDGANTITTVIDSATAG